MDEELRKRHQWFAIESNNQAWDLSTRDRTPLEDQEMLNVAHASAWHWGKIGEEINRMRAMTLLAHVHAFCGLGPSALAYAEECSDYFSSRETDDWEIAFVHMVVAQASHAVGDLERFETMYQKTLDAIDAIKSDEDRKIVMVSLARIPKP